MGWCGGGYRRLEVSECDRGVWGLGAVGGSVGGGEWGMRWWVELDLINVRNSPHIFVASPDN